MTSKEERSARIIHELLEMGSFGPVDAVENTHEQAEKFLDEYSPGWRDMELIDRAELARLRARPDISAEEVGRSEGVPEFVYVGNAGVIFHNPMPGQYRYRFDGIVAPENEEGR